MTSLIKAFAKVAHKAADLSVKVNLSIQFLSASLRLIGEDTRHGIKPAARNDLNTVLAHATPQRVAYAGNYEAAAGGHKTSRTLSKAHAM